LQVTADGGDRASAPLHPGLVDGLCNSQGRAGIAT